MKNFKTIKKIKKNEIYYLKYLYTHCDASVLYYKTYLNMNTKTVWVRFGCLEPTELTKQKFKNYFKKFKLSI